MRVISVPRSTYSHRVPAVHKLLFAGIKSFTLTVLVSSLIGFGVTVIFAPLIPAIFMMLFATASASATDAPGTIACRAASYEALSAR